MFCFLFLQPVWLSCAHLGMVWQISSPGTSWMSKLSITVKTTDVTSATRDPHRRFRVVHLSAIQQVSRSAITFSERWYRQGSHSTRWLFLPTRKDIWESTNSNSPGLEQVVYTHQTSWQRVSPRGLGELIPSHHSWNFSSFSVDSSPRSWLFTFATVRTTVLTLSDIWRSTSAVGAPQLRIVTEIAPKSPLLCVNRSLIKNGFRIRAPGGTPHMKGVGMLVGNFELNT